MDLHIEEATLQRAMATKDHPVYKEITRTLDTIWGHTKQAKGNRRNTHGLPLLPPRPPMDIESTWDRAAERTQEGLAYQSWLQEQRKHRPRVQPSGGSQGRVKRRRKRPKRTSPIATWANLEWHRRWTCIAGGKTPAAWNTPWHRDPLTLYEGLPKHQAMALMLLRTEVIGLNAWLASVRVPGVLPHCDCGWHAQTVKHVLLHCPKFEQQRLDLIQETQSENLQQILSNTTSAQAAARWLVHSNILQQFWVAREMELENVTTHSTVPRLERQGTK